MTDDEILYLWTGDTAPPRPVMGRNKVLNFARIIAARQRELDAEICESFIHTYVKDGERWMRGITVNQILELKTVPRSETGQVLLLDVRGAEPHAGRRVPRPVPRQWRGWRGVGEVEDGAGNAGAV